VVRTQAHDMPGLNRRLIQTRGGIGRNIRISGREKTDTFCYKTVIS